MNFKSMLSVLLAVFGILGGVVTVLDIYDRANKDDPRTILWAETDQAVFSLAKNFDAQIKVVGQSEPQKVNEDVVESHITIWRTSGEPITKDQVREPFTIAMPAESKLIDFRIVDNESSSADDLRVERVGNHLNVLWSVFDPNAALKISLIRTGEPENMAVSRSIGPNINIEKPSDVRKTWLELAIIGFGIVIFYACVLGIMYMVVRLTLPKTDHAYKLEKNDYLFVLGLTVLCASLLFGNENRWPLIIEPKVPLSSK